MSILYTIRPGSIDVTAPRHHLYQTRLGCPPSQFFRGKWSRFPWNPHNNHATIPVVSITGKGGGQPQIIGVCGNWYTLKKNTLGTQRHEGLVQMAWFWFNNKPSGENVWMSSRVWYQHCFAFAQGPPVFDLLFLSTSLGKYSPGPAVFDRMHWQNTSQKNVRYTNPSCTEGGLSVSWHGCSISNILFSGPWNSRGEIYTNSCKHSSLIFDSKH